MTRCSTRSHDARGTLDLLSLCWILAIATFTTPAIGQERTDIFCGDSLAFGVGTNAELDLIQATGPVDPSTRGYNGAIASFLTNESGQTSQIVALGNPGETTSSFSQYDPSAANYNLNYSVNESQLDLVHAALLEADQAGRPVATFSIHIGVNDMLDAMTDPGFFNQPPAQVEAALAAQIDIATGRAAAILSEVAASAPGAQLVIIGYYDPFPGLSNPAAFPLPGLLAYSTSTVLALNASLAVLATSVDAVFVDPFDRFDGQEAALTYIDGVGSEYANVHPKPAGYAEIGAAWIEAFEALSLPCPADTNLSGTVNVEDLVNVIVAWGTDDAAADVVPDGVVNVSDLVAVFEGWGPCP